MSNNMKEYKVKSSTSNQIYIVRYFDTTDKWVCECPSYAFGPKGFECKHILFIKEQKEKSEKLTIIK